MPVYILYQGRLIEKRYKPSQPQHAASELASPSVVSFSAYPSPIDDATISSHRQRDKDLHNSGSYDPRDTPVEFKKARDVRQQQQRRRTVATEP
jgi:hypothetical protein